MLGLGLGSRPQGVGFWSSGFKAVDCVFRVRVWKLRFWGLRVPDLCLKNQGGANAFTFMTASTTTCATGTMSILPSFLRVRLAT